MKGIKKIGSFALSAAMVAGLSTPVFAANADSTRNVTGAETVTVYNSAGDAIASTDSSVKRYDFDGEASTISSDWCYAQNVKLVPGGTVNLTAELENADDKTVKWAYDETTTTATDKKAVTLTSDGANATITVNNTTTEGTDYVDIVAYISGEVDSNGDLTGSHVVLHVFPTELTSIELNYVNRDDEYLESDLTNDVQSLQTYLDTETTALPTIENSTGALSRSGSKKINHVELGSSASFEVNFVIDVSGDNPVYDDSDYNTKVAYMVQGDTLDANGDVTLSTVNNQFISVKGTTNANTGTVSVVGTKSGGHSYVTAYLKGITPSANATESDKLYVVSESVDSVKVYRLYNSNTGEHFYTTVDKEVVADVAAGWTLEGYAWDAPTSGTPVYRVYNSNAGEHLFTTSENEKNTLVAAGWTDEGIAFYSASSVYTPVYRQYNPNAFAFNHNYTTASTENNYLVSMGWKAEGVAFYAVAAEDTSATRLTAWIDANN